MFMVVLMLLCFGFTLFISLKCSSDSKKFWRTTIENCGPASFSVWINTRQIPPKNFPEPWQSERSVVGPIILFLMTGLCSVLLRWCDVVEGVSGKKHFVNWFNACQHWFVLQTFVPAETTASKMGSFFESLHQKFSAIVTCHEFPCIEPLYFFNCNVWCYQCESADLLILPMAGS